jgi:hypothetical protein
MKMLAWPRLLFTALVLAFLFGILAYARGQSPKRLDWSATCYGPHTFGRNISQGHQPEPRSRLDWAAPCPCPGGGVCTCGADCPCPGGRPTVKKADDGGPDWNWDWQRGNWVRPVGVHEEPRSPLWPKVRAEHLKREPACAACGTTSELNVHHVLPFKQYPERELDDSNLITLCREHHFVLGHSGNWSTWNPNVRADAAKLRARTVLPPLGFAYPQMAEPRMMYWNSFQPIGGFNGGARGGSC